jgi:hypothetical protein
VSFTRGELLAGEAFRPSAGAWQLTWTKYRHPYDGHISLGAVAASAQ